MPLPKNANPVIPPLCAKGYGTRAPEEDAVVSPAARKDSPIRTPRQAPNALEVEAPPPPWDNGGEPPQHGVDAHVAYVGGDKHRPIGGQGHGLDRVEVLPPP